MLRSRFLWFTFGFASTYAVLSQVVLKDLMLERHALTSHMERDFRILEARLSNIEESSSSVPLPIDQVEGVSGPAK
ncbi:hypothetical protein AAZX31_07G057500 [Glycine max]|uniref:Uncharacterized protein n=2 Tax=Glycine subgen. Soja TaxID=1462606 RepID=C6T0X5_SOYBN|nr:uncharacterized protein LOC100500194 [Glycine max]XP_028239437.1 uncharacterized protein LOC114418340 [Glycine soja]ACU15170.1 unknown [Glycine max]KAG5009103.1 hypothetical protein JHK87_017618 [Glycine soja]KAG5036890.1 hypothetical protein JHK86_017730 [Glycine max]KAG5141979.1 hypothetical protein JHK82_017674 [Glycine max]KAH1085635.1 hypothetical protein GYH30_017547 [Glycine max]|eukprot:XP_003528807.1 uncharacterized protein LOC100500194 [Glycine max]